MITLPSRIPLLIVTLLFKFIMPIDLVHNDFFALYKPRVCNCFSGNARHYKTIEKLSFPETSVEPITNFGKIGL